MEEISFNEFQRLDLRVGKIKKAEDHPNADKLVILKVDIGSEERTLVAGIKQHYKPKDLVGKKIVVVTNLKPANLRGVESKGMLLAAVKGDDIVLVQPEKDIGVGAKVQ